MHADDIVRQRFTKVFRGYDVQEVDIFLDEVIRTLDELERDRNVLLSRVEALLNELDRYDALLTGKTQAAAAMFEPQQQLAAAHQNIVRHVEHQPSQPQPQPQGVSNMPAAAAPPPVGTIQRFSPATHPEFSEEHSSVQPIAFDNTVEETPSFGHPIGEPTPFGHPMGEPPSFGHPIGEPPPFVQD